ncbi:hypothetical protein L208DRAFT_1380821 [Tricholoma matsutake]|nr:hypothetical protein L208DRAFT_1380821 [Tricholoma matsutake 945]
MSGSGFDPSPYLNNLDPTQAAKQIAALNAASQARIANSRPAPQLNLSGGTNSAPFLGGINPPNYPATNHDLLPGSSVSHTTFQMQNNPGLPPTPNSASFLDPSMSQPSAAARNPQHPSNSLKQRQQGFLQGLANVMAKRGTPLPPALTGVPVPNYDHGTSMWKTIELSSEVGSFRLAGKDIDLFKLWGLVFQNGGGSVVTSNNGWSAILAQFSLPGELSSQPSVAQTLGQYYMAMLHPFEEMYKRNMQDQQKKAQISRQGGAQSQHPPSVQGRPMQVTGSGSQSAQLQRGPPGPLSMNGAAQFTHAYTPQTPHQRPSSANLGQPDHSTPNSLSTLPDTLLDAPQANGFGDGNVLDQEMQGIKRKMDFDLEDTKRARQKTGSEPPEVASSVSTTAERSSAAVMTNTANATQALTASPAPPRPRQQPSRRRIEYVPLGREVETYGGRDLNPLESEVMNISQRRPLRDLHDWGIVDIEALTMSIRSRLSTELSYALTTFTLLSTMRGQTPGSGFPVFQSSDLLDETLDLLEELAFGDVEDAAEHYVLDGDAHLTTNRALINLIHGAEVHPFSALQPRQGVKDPDLGPRQRPGNIIIAILNIIRNLTTIPDNVEFISRQHRLIDLLLRLCTLVHVHPGQPSPASSALSFNDLVVVRKDTLYTFTNIAGNIHFASDSSHTALRMASRAFQLISSYLVDPVEAVSPAACVQRANGNVRPPLLADIALDVFTRLSQADSNRQIFAKAIPHGSISRLFEALVHRLPVVDADFQLMTRELWLSYLEKNIMAIYSLAFLAPPEVKQKVKADRALSFKAVMLRMVQKFLDPGGRTWFMVCIRRAIEAMKVLDDAEDSFDTSKSMTPTMSFGMGYGEIGDNGAEKGTGLLGGHRDIAWDMLMTPEVYGDEVMFTELESLARVEC